MITVVDNQWSGGLFDSGGHYTAVLLKIILHFVSLTSPTYINISISLFIFGSAH